MKNKKNFFFAFTVVFFAALVSAAFFIFKMNSPEPEQMRAKLNEAQRILGVLRNIENASQMNSQVGTLFDVSAKAGEHGMVFSESWRAAGLPEVDLRGGFEFMCSSKGGFCQATEIGSPNHSMRINIESGNYECLGEYKPVVTNGFSGEDVIIGCQVQD